MYPSPHKADVTPLVDGTSHTTVHSRVPWFLLGDESNVTWAVERG